LGAAQVERAADDPQQQDSNGDGWVIEWNQRQREGYSQRGSWRPERR
jgi:hypothetical protein